jgi:hypothetical protein
MPETDLGADRDHDHIPDVIDPSADDPANATTRGIDSVEVERHATADNDGGETREANVTTHGTFEAPDGQQVESSVQVSRTQHTGADGSGEDVVRSKGDSSSSDGTSAHIERSHGEATDAEGHRRVTDASTDTRYDGDGNATSNDDDSVETVDGEVISEHHLHTGPDAGAAPHASNPFDFGDLGTGDSGDGANSSLDGMGGDTPETTSSDGTPSSAEDTSPGAESYNDSSAYEDQSVAAEY